MTDTERLVTRSLQRTQDALSASPCDIQRCRDALCELEVQVLRLLDERIPRLTMTGQDWSVALLAAARSDLSAAEALAEHDCPTVLCMLLQMTFEKLAKAALARVEIQSFRACRRSHAVASRFLEVLRRDPRFRELHYSWKDVFSVVRMLEESHPALARKGPHLEYPWEADGRMALPSELPVVREFDDPRNNRGQRVLRFARELSDRFDEFF